MPAPEGRRAPAGRYDAPSLVGQRVLAVALGLLFVGLLVAVGLALYERIGSTPVRGRVISFDIRGEREVRIDVEVAKQEGGRAYCVVRARGASGLEVGRDVAVLDGTGTPSQQARGTIELATTERAVTGELAGCTDRPLTRADID